MDEGEGDTKNNLKQKLSSLRIDELHQTNLRPFQGKKKVTECRRDP